MNVLSISADESHSGMRLDVFLSKAIDGCSRAQATSFIKSGNVTLLGKPVKASMILRGIEVLEVLLPEKKSNVMEKENIPLHILFSDEHLAVIVKPKGLVVHPGAGTKSGTLCNALLYHFPEMQMYNAERPGLVHRLDKDTSGIMVVAKSAKVHQMLSDDFKHRRINKVYTAFCHGELRERSFELKTGHARHPSHRLKFLTALPEPLVKNANVRMAHTSFVVEASAFGITKLKAILHTGRTHQIRAHMADIGHPLVADVLYGGMRPFKGSAPAELVVALSKIKGQALHARSLEFIHPITKEPLFFSAPLSDDLLEIDQFFKAAD